MSSVRPMLSTCAVTVVAIASAAVIWFAGAGTALAPEPARLTQTIYDSNGATAAGVYVNSGAETGVVKWPGSYAPSAPAPAGTPCSTTGLPSGAETAQVMVRYGGYGKCQ